MSIVDLAVSEGPLASAHLLALGALAFGIVPVPPARLRLARNYFLVSCAIFAGIAIMWGITTDYSTWPRVLVVGTLVGLGGVGAVESTRLIMLGQNVKKTRLVCLKWLRRQLKCPRQALKRNLDLQRQTIPKSTLRAPHLWGRSRIPLGWPMAVLRLIWAVPCG